MRATFSRAAALLLFCAAATFVEAEWKVTNASRELSPNEKVEHWTTGLTETTSGARATLQIAVFESSAADLRVIDQTEPPRRGLAEVMEERKALAGVNGGYFDPEDAPVGLLVSDGRTLAPLRKAKLLSGVLSTTGRRVEIVRANRFEMSSKIREALQCGPMLVENGKPVAGLNQRRPARRTFAAVDGKGRTALGVSSAVSLAQMAEILSAAKSTGDLKVRRALNLDGGSSSAFWFAGAQRDFSQPELKTVRDFVAIFPRS